MIVVYKAIRENRNKLVTKHEASNLNFKRATFSCCLFLVAHFSFCRVLRCLLELRVMNPGRNNRSGHPETHDARLFLSGFKLVISEVVDQ